MNDALKLLSSLKDVGVKVYLENGKLKTRSQAGSITDELATQIRENKTALVSLLARLDTPDVADCQHPITKAKRTDDLPLSFSQQRLWFIDQLGGGSNQYNMVVSYDVTGSVDVDVLAEAFAKVIQRHEILRTIYTNTAAGPVQQVKDSFDFKVNVVEVPAGRDIEAECEMVLAEEVGYIFNLSQDLMLRATYINLPSAEAAGILLINIHHIASDGWSLEILVREFFECYVAVNESREADLPPLVLQYADYACWQRSTDSQSLYARQLRYWKDQLKDAAPTHNLPLDGSRSADRAFRGEEVHGQLDLSVAGKLGDLAREWQVTPFMLFHAALCLVIARHTNNSEVIIGTPVANRPNAELQSMIGFFVNTIVLKTDTDFDDLPTYLEHVRTRHLEAQENQDIPFDKLVEELNIPRRADLTPLFQIMLTTVNEFSPGGAHKNEITLPGVTLKECSHPCVAARFDLEFDISLTERGISTKIIYDTDLFDRHYVERINQHLNNTLTEIAYRPQVKPREINFLSDDERRLLLGESASQQVMRPDVCLHELFLRQVVKQPQAIALCDANGYMTYAELFVCAYSAYLHLKELKLEAESLVAVRLPKGRWQLITCLAIMMSGSAYLPLEVRWPNARCQRVLAKSGCTHMFVCSDEDAVDGARSILVNDIEIADIDAVTIADSQPSWASPKDLAYVIFTSGSTGEPKGVAIEHRAAANTLFDINSRYEVTPSDKILAVSLLTFDLSVYDFFGLLAAGGQIVIPEDERAIDPEHWLELVEKEKVTLWNTVPLSAALLVDQLDYQNRQSIAPLRHILMSGDWIDVRLPARLRHKFPEVRLHSLGGATECSVWSIHYPIESDTGTWRSVPYGKPLSNQAFYVLDQYLEFTPLGVAGELFIAGDGLAREYYGDETLTSKAFFLHPTLGKRLYRTGDLGRFLPDGNIEFLGRTDHQVKIRGYRIELGEIENTIGGFGEVESCVVITSQDSTNQKRLIAYVKPVPGVVGDTAVLRTALSTTLPAYMVPDAIVPVDSWPLSANGKLDKNALPDPVDFFNTQDYVEPETDTEKELVRIWSKLLDLKQEAISVTSGFFDIGGHSLLAIRLVAAINNIYPGAINIQNVFSHGSIRSIAELIDRNLSIARLENEMSQMQDAEELLI